MATRKRTQRRTTRPEDSDDTPRKPDNGGTKSAQDAADGTPGGDTVRAHLGEAGSHLKAAARAAAETLGSAVGEAAHAAREEFGEGGERIRESLHEARSAGVDALHAGTSPELDLLLTKGREFTSSAESMIRARPLAAFGVALATGYLLARLLRRL
jgi:ElaB/YqjD/DUF883 family membrane-anchored ribosome-binding protein